MHLSLTPELEKLIDNEVTSGRSADSAEFLKKAVYHYVAARDLGEAYSPEEIEHLIVEGLADIDRGDVIDGEEAFRELRAHSAERRRQRA
jgi:antitoxin ParD1/3/4